MRTLLLIILSLVYLSANGQTFEKKGRFVSDPLSDTIVTVFIGSDTTGGGGIGLISNADTSYVYATGDCLTILADTIRLNGYVDYVTYPTAFGEMGFGDSLVAQDLTQNEWHVVTNASTNLWSTAAIDTHNVEYTNDSLLILIDGYYAVHAQISVDGKAGSIIRLGIYINGSLACECTGYQQLSNNEIFQINYINIDYLSADDVVQVVLTNTQNADDVDAVAGKITLHKID